jgi:hypothetical protein
LSQHRVLGVLARISPTKAFLGALALGIAGLFLPVPYGPILLLLVVAALGALLARTWRVTPPGLRAARLLILAGLVAIALLRLLT